MRGLATAGLSAITLLVLAVPALAVTIEYQATDDPASDAITTISIGWKEVHPDIYSDMAAFRKESLAIAEAAKRATGAEKQRLQDEVRARQAQWNQIKIDLAETFRDTPVRLYGSMNGEDNFQAGRKWALDYIREDPAARQGGMVHVLFRRLGSGSSKYRPMLITETERAAKGIEFKAKMTPAAVKPPPAPPPGSLLGGGGACECVSKNGFVQFIPTVPGDCCSGQKGAAPTGCKKVSVALPKCSK